MHPRLRLDVGWLDLLWGLGAVGWSTRPGLRARRVEQAFCDPALCDPACARVALSVRSGFEAYLTALALPSGSEVLVSAWTIPHMVDLLQAHGLRSVPFDLDPRTLAPPAGELERRASPRTRAVLFAHLFGARADLGPTVALARERGWLVWEDAAQALGSDDWRGTPGADLVLFSLGLIKTRTAVQGALLCVRDAALRARLDRVQDSWPRVPRRDLARRLLRAAALHALARPALFGLFARVLARRGKDIDEVLHQATRGFPGADWIARLRRRPSAPLLALLERRLRRPAASLWAARRRAGERALAELGPDVEVMGRAAPFRGHWVFVVGCDEPLALVRDLRAAGFDATARSSLVCVRASADGRPTAAAQRIAARWVYVPLVPAASAAERARWLAVLRTWARGATLPAGERAASAAQPPATHPGPAGPPG